MPVSLKEFISFQSLIKFIADYFVFGRILRREIYYIPIDKVILLFGKFSKYYNGKDFTIDNYTNSVFVNKPKLIQSDGIRTL